MALEQISSRRLTQNATMRGPKGMMIVSNDMWRVEIDQIAYGSLRKGRESVHYTAWWSVTRANTTKKQKIEQHAHHRMEARLHAADVCCILVRGVSTQGSHVVPAEGAHQLFPQRDKTGLREHTGVSSLQERSLSRRVKTQTNVRVQRLWIPILPHRRGVDCSARRGGDVIWTLRLRPTPAVRRMLQHKHLLGVATYLTTLTPPLDLVHSIVLSDMACRVLVVATVFHTVDISIAASLFPGIRARSSAQLKRVAGSVLARRRGRDIVIPTHYYTARELSVHPRRGTSPWTR
jgi:hypothetical protein